MRVVLVHGFNVRDKGARTVDRLVPFLPKNWDIDTDTADYGFFNLWMVRFARRKAIRRIAKALKEADIVVAHSNGCNYVLKALELLTCERKIKVFFFSPAVNRSTRFPDRVKKAWVYFTKVDVWVFLSAFIPFHPWGWMGYLGPKPGDDRVIPKNHTDAVGSHSGWFSEDTVEIYAEEITKNSEENEHG
jgi:hypothetical protein